MAYLNGKKVLSVVQVKGVGNLQSKSVLFSLSDQMVTPDQGYEGLSQVAIAGLTGRVRVYDTDYDMKTIDSMTVEENNLNVIIDKESGGVTIPKVTNLQVNGTTISWNAPDVSDFASYNPYVTYAILLNGTQIANGLTSTSFDLSASSYVTVFNDNIIRGGTNTVAVKVMLRLTDNTTGVTVTVSSIMGATILSTVLPTKLYGSASVKVGNYIYLFGGATAGNSSTTGYCVNTIYKFDPDTDTITTLSATLPVALFGIAACAVGSNIYLFGGTTNSYYNDYSFNHVVNTIYKYDTVNDLITTLTTTVPVSFHTGAAQYVNNYIYLFCGESEKLYKFDPIAETITDTSISTYRAKAGSGNCLIENYIYYFGGSTYSNGYNSTGVRGNSIDRFDAISETITYLPSLPFYITDMGYFEKNGYIFLINGFTATTSTGSTSYSRQIIRYDTTSNTSTTLFDLYPTIKNIYGKTMCSFGNYIYSFGGAYSTARGSTNPSNSNVFNEIVKINIEE